MIETRFGEYVPVCDFCGAELPAQKEYNDAVHSVSENGWAKKKNFDTMEYEHLCDTCVGIATGRDA